MQLLTTGKNTSNTTLRITSVNATTSLSGYETHQLYVYQGSHASWKVLHFSLENSRTWKVLEIKA